MTEADTIPSEQAPPIVPVPLHSAVPSVQPERLFRTLWLLTLPILAENLLHMIVGFTDTYLAGHLRENSKAATAAVGSVAYVLWLVNLMAMAIASGATAIVARAIGARHKRLANRVTGQAVAAAAILGLSTAILFSILADPLANMTGLEGTAFEFARYYFRVLSFSLPFSITTVAAAACLRGAGDTKSPAIAMIVVDLVNVALSYGLARGAWGLPEMGFRGIAVGTVVAYTIGGIILVVVLARGSIVRLYWHRLWPHWQTLKRLLRIGLPAGVGDILPWFAQFLILRMINQLDATNVSGAAHMVTIRVESFSFTFGLAFMGATATLVGQSLGRKDPARAARAAWLAFACGAAVMLSWGVAFAVAGKYLAGFMNDDPAAVALSAQCLFITSFAQLGFAATLVFGGALRGAGDTMVVMLINLISQIGLRLGGVIVLTQVLRYDLRAVWFALAAELSLRGLAIFIRFQHGGWKHVAV
jgi:putative MATE family efflux protein